MSKVLSVCLVLILLVSLLCYFTDSTFNLKAYADNLNDLPDKPTLPSFDYVNDAFTNIDDSDVISAVKSLAKAIGVFFEFLFNCIAYPFRWIAYIIEVVLVLTNGMIVRG